MPKRRNPLVAIKSIKITGIKSIVGSLLKIDSINIGRAVLPLATTALMAGGIIAGGEAVGAWDVLDEETRAVEVIAIIPTGEPGNIILIPAQTSPTILEEILAAALDDPVFTFEGVSRAEVEAIVDAAVARILDAYVPPGPPIKHDGIRDTVDENNCLLKSGRTCPEFPESVTE